MSTVLRSLDLVSSGPHGSGAVAAIGPAAGRADLGVLLLHGRGGSARDLLELGLAAAPPGALLVAPEAVGRTWYPQRFLAPREANEPWLSSALARVEALGEKLLRDGPGPERTVVVGFSQGACLAAEAVARSRFSWAGLAALTGGLIGPLDGELADPGERPSLKVLLTSGDPDPHVPWRRMEETAQRFRSAGASVDLRRYPGRAHTVGSDEVEALSTLLRGIVAGGSDQAGLSPHGGRGIVRR